MTQKINWVNKNSFSAVNVRGLLLGCQQRFFFTCHLACSHLYVSCEHLPKLRIALAIEICFSTFNSSLPVISSVTHLEIAWAKFWQWTWSCNFSFLKAVFFSSLFHSSWAFSYPYAHYSLHALLPVDHLTPTGRNETVLGNNYWETLRGTQANSLKQIRDGANSRTEHTSPNPIVTFLK